MDNIKTKLQTQNTANTCERIDSLFKDANLNNPINKDVKTNFSINSFSTVNKLDCNTDNTIKYKNILSTVKYIWKEEGLIKGFFKGVSPRVINNSPSCAISWGTYELVKHFLAGKGNK